MRSFGINCKEEGLLMDHNGIILGNRQKMYLCNVNFYVYGR